MGRYGMSDYDYAIEYDDSPSPDPYDGYRPDRDDDDEVEKTEAQLQEEAWEAEDRENEAKYAYLQPYAAVMVEKFGNELRHYTPMYWIIDTYYGMAHPPGWNEPAEHITPNWVMKRANRAKPDKSVSALAEIQGKLIGADNKLIPTYEIGKLVLETLRRHGLGPEFVPTEDNLGF